MTASIPRIIHQTWRDSEVPEKWLEFQRSWRRHHPEWEYRFWTDLELRRLIQESYPWFLSIYDNYPEAIQRVDAARCFLMHRIGGVYADLDFECLRPMGPLLDRRELVLGFEPEAHTSKPVVAASGFERVVCNAFLASRPGHPFWERFFLRLVGAHRIPGPLLSTGPFLLTETLTEALRCDPSLREASITCLGSELLYPGTSEDAKEGRLRDPKWRASNCGEAYAIHHWSGSWIRQILQNEQTGELATESDPTWAPVTVVSRGRPTLTGECRLDASEGALQPAGNPPPRVSCLMVTRAGRLACAKRAIACFLAQSYPEKELVIVDDSADDSEVESLRRHLADLGDPRLVHARFDSRLGPSLGPGPGSGPETKPALGALRNFAVSRATGDYVMQWDDDDLYHPRRIELQLAALRATGSDACLLSRWRIWWPAKRRLAVSKRRGWEGSVLCARAKLPLYDAEKRRGEDTAPILRLASREKVAFLDAPWLYTYLAHGENTTPEGDLERHWAQATQFHFGQDYARRMRALASELPEPVRGELLSGLTAEKSTEEPNSNVVLPSLPKSEGRDSSGEKPSVLILTPVKDGLPFIESYFAALERLDYPAHRISLALLEGDSVDGTLEALSKRLEASRGRYARAELHKRDFWYRPSGSRSDAPKQLQRRSILARSRNLLLSRSLRDEDWVLWLDFDVVDYPADVIDRLLAHGKEIVVPHCVFAPGGRTFDLNTFVRTEKDGDCSLMQPERGSGRRYLEDLRDRELVEVDAVGGTMLLVKADLHREGLIFPVTPYKKHIETEGLSFLARDQGVSSWGDPRLEVIHANR